MQRSVRSGIAACVRVVSLRQYRGSYARAVDLKGGERGPFCTVASIHSSTVSSNGSTSINPEAAPAATAIPKASQGRHLSSKSSSQDTPDSLIKSKESSEKENAAPVNTLVSSEGSSPSLLTGPRITSKKGYLEREGMIRETQKAVREYYKGGMYQDALEVTHRLVDQVEDHFGRKHGVYGSALSDMALMMKSTGKHQEATEIYLKALEVYRAVYNGEENASFASTLHNLGMAFRAMAEESKKLEKIPLMERAAESFERCVQIREKILTNNHPDLQLARSRLAMVQGLLGGEKERTEARLRAALDGLQMAVGNEDASTANAMTNLALFLKGEGQHAEATELYTTVLETRRKLYGSKHFDVLVSMHNLSMAHHAAGREDEAMKLQDEIAAIGEEMGMTPEEQSEASEAAGVPAPAPENSPVKLLDSRPGGKKGSGKTSSKDKSQEGEEDSATTWKPAGTQKRRKNKKK